MTPVSVAFKKPRVFSLRNLSFRPIFYGTGSVQGFLHLGFRPIFFLNGSISIYVSVSYRFFPMGIIYLWYGIDISLVWELYIDRFFYGTGSVQGFLHLGFRLIFI